MIFKKGNKGNLGKNKDNPSKTICACVTELFWNKAIDNKVSWTEALRLGLALKFRELEEKKDIFQELREKDEKIEKLAERLREAIFTLQNK